MFTKSHVLSDSNEKFTGPKPDGIKILILIAITTCQVLIKCSSFAVKCAFVSIYLLDVNCYLILIQYKYSEALQKKIDITFLFWDFDVPQACKELKCPYILAMVFLVIMLSRSLFLVAIPPLDSYLYSLCL